MPPIPSGFETNRVFRLERVGSKDVTWRLQEEMLPKPLIKEYDSGHVGEWLASYQESVALDDLRFAAAWRDGQLQGLATWQELNWNRTLWLLDIRSSPGARRMGVGSALLQHIKDVALRSRLRGIHVETQINNYPAICFYRKQGFEVSGFNDHLYSNADLARQDVAIYLFRESA